MRTALLVSAVLSISLVARAQDRADAIYVNGTVVTLDEKSSVREAIAVKDGKLLAVGTGDEIRKLADENTAVHDLAGHAVVPGFYAAHDHFPGSGYIGTFSVNLNSPPMGQIETIDDLVAALKERAKTTPKGQWIRGRGYDDTLLKDHRHPTRHDLDKVSTEHPIWILHTSTHLGVGNSLALEKAKLTRDTPQPKGGKYRVDEQGEPTGVIEETLSLVSRVVPGVSQADANAALDVAAQQYVRQGVTTAVVASGGAPSVGNLKRGLARGALPFRVITMTSGGPVAEARRQIAELDTPLLKAGAIKLLQDGSIQGYTGYLSHAYCVPFEGDATYRGYPLRSREELVRRVVDLHKAGHQIAIHGNGDAAIDDILAAYEAAQKEFPRPDARHRVEHAQTARDDQLDKMKELGVTPSFFVGHVYYWGDRHAGIFLGPERAARISPLASAVKRQLKFTVHDDTPVTPVNPLQLVWVAVNRTTTGGTVLGPEQRITPEQALRAVTSDAAWQNFEESIKGTLEPGKLADFVVLEQNPLTVDPATIRDIPILETVVGGRSVYRKE